MRLISGCNFEEWNVEWRDQTSSGARCWRERCPVAQRNDISATGSAASISIQHQKGNMMAIDRYSARFTPRTRRSRPEDWAPGSIHWWILGSLLQLSSIKDYHHAYTNCIVFVAILSLHHCTVWIGFHGSLKGFMRCRFTQWNTNKFSQ